MEFRFSLASRAAVSFDVVSVTGRVVARVPATASGPGTSSVRWGGRNTSGSRVASGVYWVRMSVDGKQAASERVLVLR